MIAVDTNVLLRYLLQDDERQSVKAVALLNAGQKVLITDVVLVETIWTLKGKKYQLPKEKIVNAVHALFSEPAITFEDNQAVWCALKDYAHAKPVRSSGKVKEADFPDTLIVNKAKRFEYLNNIEIGAVYTFDRAALSIHGAQEL